MPRVAALPGFLYAQGWSFTQVFDARGRVTSEVPVFRPEVLQQVLHVRGLEARWRLGHGSPAPLEPGRPSQLMVTGAGRSAKPPSRCRAE